MYKKFKLICKNCGFVNIVINKDIFLEDDIKCSICGNKMEVININSVEEVYKDLVDEFGIEGLIEFIKDKEIEEENKDLIEYLKYKGLWERRLK